MNKTWWKESVIYKIYHRCFNDSNGDGGIGTFSDYPKTRLFKVFRGEYNMVMSDI